MVHVAGEPITFAAEIDRNPANIDHFWITIQMGDAGPLRIALSTHSRQNAAAGFDPRVRVGVIADASGICRRPAFFLRAAWITARSKPKPP